MLITTPDAAPSTCFGLGLNHVGDSVVEMTERDASVYLCRPREADEERELIDTGVESRYGTYFSTFFRFKVEAREGGVLGLRIRDDEFWPIVSYEAFEQ